MRPSPPPLPKSARYALQIQAMIDAGRVWTLAHPGARYELRQLDPRRFYIGPLSEAVIQWFGLNEDTRQLLRELDRVTRNEATITQARAALSVILPPLPSPAH